MHACLIAWCMEAFVTLQFHDQARRCIWFTAACSNVSLARLFRMRDWVNQALLCIGGNVSLIWISAGYMKFNYSESTLDRVKHLVGVQFCVDSDVRIVLGGGINLKMHFFFADYKSERNNKLVQNTKWVLFYVGVKFMS